TLDASVVWQIRLPRLVLGLFVGAALGVGGALMQAVFANPLAEPSVIGVSTGAGVGAAAAIVFGASTFGTMTVPLFAFLSGTLATAVVYRLSRSGGSV
ncbi:iron chelate uptake ABC transporter family permease subunit, partial [Escherichia coli]|nr:iron chelate uptake ABC transporter family permease subunit [Escherichia coli]